MCDLLLLKNYHTRKILNVVKISSLTFCLWTSGLYASNTETNTNLQSGPNPMTAPQQHITITGVVIDNYGEPVIGANIVQKGTVNGTVTDFDGNYSLQVPQGATLQVSYIGYLSQEIVVGSNNVINITLQEDTHALEEVVVVGYGTLQKKQVTSSITSVSADDLPVGVGGSSIATALVGKVGGLLITGTDSPNSGNTLQLRGPSSINAGKDPLVVIDGMPGGRYPFGKPGRYSFH